MIQTLQQDNLQVYEALLAYVYSKQYIFVYSLPAFTCILIRTST